MTDWCVAAAMAACCVYAHGSGAMTTGAPRPESRVLVQPDPNLPTWTLDALREDLRARAIDRIDAIDLYVLPAPDGQNPFTYTAHLLDLGLFSIVEPDVLLQVASGPPDDPMLGEQWNLERLDVEGAWDFGFTASDVIVAFVDTGVTPSHEDIQGRLMPGYNALDRLTEPQGGDVIDLNGHGTATSGIVGAVTNNATGIAGICLDVNILPVKATSGASGNAYLSDILHGCNWAIQKGADIVNVSFAGVECDAVQSMGTYAHMQGAHLVWAAGNGARDLDWFDHEDVLVVSATNENDLMYASSNFGQAIDIAAPGVRIPTLKRNGSYYNRTGSSYAAPHVSATLAVMRTARPDLDVDTIEDILLRTAGDLFTPGEDHLVGRGLVNARRAVLLALTYGGNGVGGGDDDHDPDMNDDGRVDVNDVIAFLELFWIQDPIADFDDNGIWDVMDLILFMNAWDEAFDG